MVKIGMDLKVITRNGKEYIFASKINVKIDNPSFKYKSLESEKEEFVQIYKIIDDIIANNEKEILNVVRSVAEERTSKIIISVFNNIASLNYKELFPEKT